MELLLNLFWLTFALLAVGLWWHGAISTQSERRCSRLPQLVVLSCVLILLFPVVSVTDDLHPIRPEMEESNPSKKFKAAPANHSGGFGSLPAQLDCCFSFSPNTKICGQILVEIAPVPEPAQLCTIACRAPPAPALS